MKGNNNGVSNETVHNSRRNRGSCVSLRIKGAKSPGQEARECSKFIYWIKVSFVDVIMANAKDKLEIYCYGQRWWTEGKKEGCKGGSVARITDQRICIIKMSINELQRTERSPPLGSVVLPR